MQAAVLPIIDRNSCISASKIYESMSRTAFCAGYLEVTQTYIDHEEFRVESTRVKAILVVHTLAELRTGRLFSRV